MPGENETNEPAKKKAKKIKVQATCNLSEDGVFYQKGDAFETTEDRAEALGPHITKVG